MQLVVWLPEAHQGCDVHDHDHHLAEDLPLQCCKNTMLQMHCCKGPTKKRFENEKGME